MPAVASYMLCLLWLVVLILPWEERGEERETLIGSLSWAPRLGTNSQPRHVPWPAIEPVTFWFMGRYSTQLSHTSQGLLLVIFIPMSQQCFSLQTPSVWSKPWIKKLEQLLRPTAWGGSVPRPLLKPRDTEAVLEGLKYLGLLQGTLLGLGGDVTKEYYECHLAEDTHEFCPWL